MSSLSIRKQKKLARTQQAQQIEAKHLHLVAGQHNHKHTHSLSPISADEVEKLHNINPELVDRLFKIMENGLIAEEQENKKFYEALEREQENDRLAITTKAENDKNAMKSASSIIVLLIIVGSVLIYFNHEIIGGTVLTTVLLGVARAMFKKNIDNNDSE